MARPPPPRLLSSFLGDRLLLSSRPLILRSAAPGTCHLPRCHSVAAPVFQRVGPGQQFAEMALSPSCRKQADGVSGDEDAMQLGGYPPQQEVSFHSPSQASSFLLPVCWITSTASEQLSCSERSFWVYGIIIFLLALLAVRISRYINYGLWTYFATEG